MAELAGIFLSPLLQAFFERLASGEFVNFFRGQKLDQALLEKLETTLLSVNAVFEDAEEKQVANDNVKNWLDKLKVAVYDAEDILDGIDTEAKRCKLDAEFLTTTSKVANLYLSLKLRKFLLRVETLRLQQIRCHCQEKLDRSFGCRRIEVEEFKTFLQFGYEMCDGWAMA